MGLMSEMGLMDNLSQMGQSGLFGHDLNAMDIAVSAKGLIKKFNRLGALSTFDVHLAQTLAWLTNEDREDVILAAGFVARALRQGSVCVKVAELSSQPLLLLDEDDSPIEVSSLPWPDLDVLHNHLELSSMVAVGVDAPANQRPLRLVDGLLYLERYWLYERTVARLLTQMLRQGSPTVDKDQLARDIELLYGEDSPDSEQSDQITATKTAVKSWVSVVTGGPGTGKTTMIANILAALSGQNVHPSLIALVAPTGKAAARLGESIAAVVEKSDHPAFAEGYRPQTTTIHRLLGSIGPKGFTKTRLDPIYQSVVIVDEASMVALPLMASLLEALNPQTRLILVGDADQLASVDAGAVLADIVNLGTEDQARTLEKIQTRPIGSHPVLEKSTNRIPVVRLRKTWRFKGAIADFAHAIRTGDVLGALNLLAEQEIPAPGADRSVESKTSVGQSAVTWHNQDPLSISVTSIPGFDEKIVQPSQKAYQAALLGAADTALGTLNRHRLLCARRSGPYGVEHWGSLVEKSIKALVPGFARTDGLWYPGQPILITKNQADRGLSNGDTGIVMLDGEDLTAVIAAGNEQVRIPVFLLDHVEPMHAMTIHKSQGSQFEYVTLVLPPPGSALLTRQLLYTAVTRASMGVHIIGSEESLIEAINTPAQRASGLGLVDH